MCTYWEVTNSWAGTSLAPLVASSLHGLPLRKTSTSDCQAISPAGLAQYLLKQILHIYVSHTHSYICIASSCLHHRHLGLWPWIPLQLLALRPPHTYAHIIEKSLKREFKNIKQTLLRTVHSHKSALNSNLCTGNQPPLFTFSSVFPCMFPDHLDPSLSSPWVLHLSIP